VTTEISPPSTEEVARQLSALGVERGGVLLVHASFRAVRPVDGGPLGLCAALRRALGPTGTLVMPTMTDGETIFDPRTTQTYGMGIVAELFWRQNGVLRSTHPGASFAASGPLAERICAPQPLAPPHGVDSPPGRVYELGGQILLLGVSFSECTMLHVAENIAAVPYLVSRPCVVDVGGKPERIAIAETDHCCRGFRRAKSWLEERGLLREGRVGNAASVLCRARDTVSLAVEQLALDPLVFLCPSNAGCEECDEARATAA
jgi:aminoglycoside 3-N-acetyltransferase